ncbi:MAG TPA: hypothetical protein VGL91_04220 [Acidobacteriota bacterium]
MQPVVFRVSISRWITDGWNLFLKDIASFALIGLFSMVFLTVVPLPFLWGPVWTAMAFASLRFIERGQISINDYFEGYRFFLPALFASLLIFLFTLIGLIFLIIPGLVILAMYMFTYSYISQNEQDFWQAMRSSRQVVSHDYFGFTLFMLALIFMNFLGMLFFHVGLVFTLPVSAAAVSVAFREVQGLPIAPPQVVTAPTKPIIIE